MLWSEKFVCQSCFISHEMIFFSYIIESPKFNKVKGINVLEMDRAAFHDSREKAWEQSMESQERLPCCIRDVSGEWASLLVTLLLSALEGRVFLVHASFLIFFQLCTEIGE